MMTVFEYDTSTMSMKYELRMNALIGFVLVGK